MLVAPLTEDGKVRNYIGVSEKLVKAEAKQAHPAVPRRSITKGSPHMQAPSCADSPNIRNVRSFQVGSALRRAASATCDPPRVAALAGRSWRARGGGRGQAQGGIRGRRQDRARRERWRRWRRGDDGRDNARERRAADRAAAPHGPSSPAPAAAPDTSLSASPVGSHRWSITAALHAGGLHSECSQVRAGARRPLQDQERR